MESSFRLEVVSRNLSLSFTLFFLGESIHATMAATTRVELALGSKGRDAPQKRGRPLPPFSPSIDVVERFDKFALKRREEWRLESDQIGNFAPMPLFLDAFDEAFRYP